MNQHTLKSACVFKGKGLHGGLPVTMTVEPAGPGEGIVFYRTDLGGAPVRLAPSSVASTDRSTAIAEGETKVVTVEHLLSAFSGLGIDNAAVRLDAPELPILDGSAAMYVKAFQQAGIAEQDAQRRYAVLPGPFEYRDEATGSLIRMTPCDRFEAEVTVHYDHPALLRDMKAGYVCSDDYAVEIAPCRTFCLLSEVEFLMQRGLIRGGDIRGALVVVDCELDAQRLARLQEFFGIPTLKASQNGYLDNVELHFTNECARHKILDLMGDLMLLSRPLKARVEAFKPGHRVNAAAVRALVRQYPQML